MCRPAFRRPARGDSSAAPPPADAQRSVSSRSPELHFLKRPIGFLEYRAYVGLVGLEFWVVLQFAVGCFDAYVCMCVGMTSKHQVCKGLEALLCCRRCRVVHATFRKSSRHSSPRKALYLSIPARLGLRGHCTCRVGRTMTQLKRTWARLSQPRTWTPHPVVCLRRAAARGLPR